MKLLIISDIHSNPDALRAILQAEGNCDNIYFAGDYVDYGPDPAGAIALARQLGIQGVSGNHDRRLLRIYDSGEYLQDNPLGRENSIYGPVDSASPKLRWADLNCGRAAAPGLIDSKASGLSSVGKASGLSSVGKASGLSSVGKEDIDFLRALPRCLSFTADGFAYLICHQYDDGYGTIQTRYHFDQFWEEHFDLSGCEGMPRRMIFGHTHRQLLVSPGEDRLWMNPGSISYRRPDDPSKDAFYITITDSLIELKHIPYDRSRLQQALSKARPLLHPDELRVAEFFFEKAESDGPDDQWLAYLRASR